MATNKDKIDNAALALLYIPCMTATGHGKVWIGTSSAACTKKG